MANFWFRILLGKYGKVEAETLPRTHNQSPALPNLDSTPCLSVAAGHRQSVDQTPNSKALLQATYSQSGNYSIDLGVRNGCYYSPNHV